jgi:transposase
MRRGQIPETTKTSIRVALDGGLMTQRDIAETYGVSEATVSRIASGYRHKESAPRRRASTKNSRRKKRTKLGVKGWFLDLFTFGLYGWWKRL